MADLAVSELIARYNCKKTHFYQVRLAALKAATGIEPFKRGGNDRGAAGELPLRFR